MNVQATYHKRMITRFWMLWKGWIFGESLRSPVGPLHANGSVGINVYFL